MITEDEKKMNTLDQLQALHTCVKLPTSSRHSSCSACSVVNHTIRHPTHSNLAQTTHSLLYKVG